MGLTACTEPQCLYNGALYCYWVTKHLESGRIIVLVGAFFKEPSFGTSSRRFINVSVERAFFIFYSQVRETILRNVRWFRRECAMCNLCFFTIPIGSHVYNFKEVLNLCLEFLSWLQIFVVYLRTSRKVSWQYVTISHYHFLLHSFKHSLIITS
jgi:hypothetical protein